MTRCRLIATHGVGMAAWVWILLLPAAAGELYPMGRMESLSRESARKTDLDLASEWAQFQDEANVLRTLRPIFTIPTPDLEKLQRLTREVEAINAHRATRRRTWLKFLNRRQNQPAHWDLDGRP